MSFRVSCTHRSIGYLTACWLMSAVAPPALAQSIAIYGVVKDSVSGAPVAGVRFELLRGAQLVGRAVTGIEGRFEFPAVEPGGFTLVGTRIDYRPLRQALTTTADRSVDLGTLFMAPLAHVINPVIVSASRSAQPALDAPVAVSVIERRAVEERPALTLVDHIHGVPGVDVATTGLTQHEVVSRGFNNISSGSLLVLTDHRYAALPSLRINVFNFIPATNDDVERIEVVRGPGAALYGPNSANGVMHVVTRSPLESRGTTFTLSGGERSLFGGSARHASALGPNLGVKLSGQYLRGTDWGFDDPVEQANRALALAGGADPDTLRIGARDPTVERASGEARLDWLVASGTEIGFTFGVNHARRNVEVTSVGAAQARDWQYWFGQARLTRGSLFAQVFLNQSHAGETYLVRSGAPVVDDSRMLVGQVQHGVNAGTLGLRYGIDAQRTEPRTGGTITGRNEDDDVIDELGAYLHGTTHLASHVELVTAARLDWHSRLPDLIFSPRAGVVWRPRLDHTMRLTFNRAFATPSTNNLFLDLVAGAVPAPAGPPLPFTIRVTGVPPSGYTFPRDCGGPCMRSPFTPAALGGPTTYVPIDGTPMWDNILDTLAARGFDFRGIPAPSSAEVGTTLRLLDGVTETFSPVDSALSIPRLRPAITNAIELGYRGVLGGRLLVGLDVYYERKHDFVGPPRIETPTAHYDSATLATYLASYMSVDSARLVAGLASLLPIGTVSPAEARDPSDLIITYRNFGDIDVWGADVEVGWFVTPTLAVYGTYSWVSRDLFPDASGIAVPLNAPKHKGSVRIEYRHPGAGISLEVRGRTVDGFPINSGVYIGRVERYTVVDAQIAYRLAWARNVMLTVNGQNLLDERHAEFVGTPDIGRLVVGRVRVEF